MESEGQKTFVPLHDFVVEVIQYCKPLHWEEAVACVNLVEKDSVGLASHYVSGGLPYLLTSQTKNCSNFGKDHIRAARIELHS